MKFLAHFLTHLNSPAPKARRAFSAALLLVLLASQAAPLVPVRAQDNDPVGAMISRMTTEEKVGQLFLVNFTGTNADATSQIYDLITNHHIGGVVLSKGDDNFVAAPDTAAQANLLITTLQQAEWNSSLRPTGPSHFYVPLLVGISQEGGGYPNDQILSGLTPIPDEMAIGATWDRSLAEQAGQVMGRELSSLGFNLYLGLSLDVLNLPDPAVNTDLNTRVFGGDPYWTGQMGRAFLSGLHGGADGRMLAVAMHFPGGGGSDRPSDQEVSTVRRSLDELEQIDLAPFFDVTGSAPSLGETIDGLLVSHIRYQGLQGNIRASTRPISFDQQVLSNLLSLPQIQPWRKSGGLLISDNLGVPAVRRFYDPDNKSFSSSLTASYAFLAGNDMLYMGNIVSSDGKDNYSAVIDTLNFFTQKYNQDKVFAARVDESLRRILTAKFRIYPSFAISLVSPTNFQKDTLGQGNDNVSAIAKEAATLISPSQSDLAAVLPAPPKTSDYIVFLTDLRYSRQCSTCADTPVLAKDAFQISVSHLYGPAAGTQILPSHLSSYSFTDLDQLAQGQLATPDLLNDLRRADIVVISVLDMPEGQPQIQTLRNFLTQNQSSLASKRVILFSFGAPYYLDATDISKLTAYYGIYSGGAPFLEVAARILFQEITPGGALPVSVPGIGYDLTSATAPDPDQVISLNLDLPSPVTPTAVATSKVIINPKATATPSPTPPTYKVGDTIAIRTGVILDHNKHPVPDGTVVHFVLAQGDSSSTQQTDGVTTDGIASTSFRLDKVGSISIQASSEPARKSVTMTLTVNTDIGGTVVIVTPTSEATLSPTPIPPTPEPPPSTATLVAPSGYPTFLGWFLLVMVIAAGLALAYWLGTQFADTRWAIRWAALVTLGGLTAYNYLVLEMPGSTRWVHGRGLPAFLQAIVLGEIIGFLVGWFWRLMAERRNQTDKKQESAKTK